MNKLKHIFFASMLMASMTAAAQETYQDAKLAAPQLTGTARYVGMGGAMEALGADISTIMMLVLLLMVKRVILPLTRWVSYGVRKTKVPIG